MQRYLANGAAAAVLTMFTDAVWAQGLPVNTGSHLPVTLLFIGSGFLGIAIVYGIMRNRRRTQSEKTLTEEATKEVYRAEDTDRRAS
jgi:hypothetical protein